MNKISMNALNAGWSIGFGTQIRPTNADFETALSRNDVVVPEAPQGRTLETLIAEYAAKAEVFLASLGRRFAH